MECPKFLVTFQKAYNLITDPVITNLAYNSALDLNVTSEKIIASDPYYCGDEESFTGQIPLGR